MLKAQDFTKRQLEREGGMKKSAAFKSGYIAAELGKSVNTNPYRGKPDSDDFRKGFYQWLKDRGLKMK
jgi:hypothetical protein